MEILKKILLGNLISLAILIFIFFLVLFAAFIKSLFASELAGLAATLLMLSFLLGSFMGLTFVKK